MTSSPARWLDIDWVVLTSLENAEHDRCLDLFRRPNGSFGFEEFRRDAEDQGRWTRVAHYRDGVFASEREAHEAATRVVGWLRPGSS